MGLNFLAWVNLPEFLFNFFKVEKFCSGNNGKYEPIKISLCHTMSDGDQGKCCCTILKKFTNMRNEDSLILNNLNGMIFQHNVQRTTCFQIF